MDRSEIEDMLASAIKEEIDREIKQSLLVSYFVDQGWSVVSIDSTDLEDIGSWMQENIRGNWRGFTTQWVFEDQREAILFKMRWA